jgi:hypothetical protein
MYFLIAQQKALQEDEVSAMIEKLSIREKKTNQKARERIWLVKSG